MKWIKGINYEVEHDWEAELPYGLGADAVMTAQCSNCGMRLVLNVWSDNNDILVEDGGDGSCNEDDEE